MQVQDFVKEIGTDFYTGVPDSQLKALCDYLYCEYGIGKNHIVAENEGGAVALVAGFYLATGKIPCVYMQNSGIGNAVNPICSLTNDKVYGIPMVLVIGWRGEPEVADEPQHIFQGEITLDLLETLEISYCVVTKDMQIAEIKEKMHEFQNELLSGKTVAFVVKKGALVYDEKVKYSNPYKMTRERAIELITLSCPENSVIVSTTGKASRELFEIREQRKEGHEKDFLTVGSMGHSSLIGLSIALQKKDKKIYVLDGDGAVLMHTGAMAIIGNQKPENYIHIVLNNGAHETVGGMPTVFQNVDCRQLALSLGYRKAWSIDKETEIESIIKRTMNIKGPLLIEIKVALGARNDLGRPTRTPKENKIDFMKFLR